MTDLTIASADPTGSEAALLFAHLDADITGTQAPITPDRGAANRLAEDTTFLVVYSGGRPVACGAFRPLDAGAVEIKRMYVDPELRRRGVARKILAELENRARRAGFATARLETGDRMSDAIRLYESAGYGRIANYGMYANKTDSVCFEKTL
jgi:GNAT superfamily N-acetyltransferase